MKEHPILFSGPMVRAILEGRKTMTRRVVKPQLRPLTPDDTWYLADRKLWTFAPKKGGHFTSSDVAWFNLPSVMADIQRPCPYGVPGDRLNVRETWNADGCDHVIFKADGGSATAAGYAAEPKWKPSIHMPRKYCRILLEVVSVRVERVQDISEEDAKAEGVDWYPALQPIAMFQDLWDSINAKRGLGWDVNPWVWVVEFKRVTAATEGVEAV
jgi:hypothetical protein